MFVTTECSCKEECIKNFTKCTFCALNYILGNTDFCEGNEIIKQNIPKIIKQVSSDSSYKPIYF